MPSPDLATPNAPQAPSCPIRLASRASGARAYAPPAPSRPIDLRLDANEGPACAIDWRAVLGPDGLAGASIQRYPSTRELEAILSRRWGVTPERVIVTAGGDDAIDRACRVTLEPGRAALLPSPTFEMFDRYARLAGGEVVRVPWGDKPFPTRDLLRAIDDRTAMIVVVSPNNPTGAIAPIDALAQLSRAAPRALLFVDCAYAEFADEDLTPAALQLPNALVLRTFSKAYGLAGVRVGYAIGPEPVISAMRAAGAPYAASGLSLRIARWALDAGAAERFAAQIRVEREALTRELARLGARPFPSQANFVLAEFADAAGVWDFLAQQAIAVRKFAPDSGLDRCLRITCPANEQDFARLLAALRSVPPETLAPPPRSPSPAFRIEP
jgi:histidinol-phosphate aminotransferase